MLICERLCSADLIGPTYKQYKNDERSWKVVLLVGSETDMSRARTIGQVQKVTRAESPGCLAMGKTVKTKTSSLV